MIYSLHSSFPCPPLGMDAAQRRVRIGHFQRSESLFMAAASARGSLFVGRHWSLRLHRLCDTFLFSVSTLPSNMSNTHTHMFWPHFPTALFQPPLVNSVLQPIVSSMSSKSHHFYFYGTLHGRVIFAFIGLPMATGPFGWAA